MTPAFRKLIALLAVTMLALAACGGDDADTNGTDSPTEATTAPPGPTPDDSPGDAIELEAENIAFDTNEITVPVATQVVIDFRNQDPVPHNFAAYQSEDADEEIFVGDLITGPDAEITYTFDAPTEPGTYFFRCDVHPEMTGDFVVE